MCLRIDYEYIHIAKGHNTRLMTKKMFIDCGVNVLYMLFRTNYSESDEKIMCPKKEKEKKKDVRKES